MPTSMKLAARLDTAAADNLRESLTRARGADLCLDAHDVTLLGARSLEVLLTAAHVWTRDGHALSVDGISAEMAENLERFGVDAAALETGSAA